MEGARIYTHEGSGPVGLDTRARPASMQARIIQGLKQSAPFSSLQRRIIFFNLIGLAILVMGVMYLNQFRSGLIEMRVEALRTQGEIIAITIARLAAHPLVARQAEPTAPSRKNRPAAVAGRGTRVAEVLGERVEAPTLGLHFAAIVDMMAELDPAVLERLATDRIIRPSRSLVDWTCPGLVERSLSLT